MFPDLRTHPTPAQLYERLQSLPRLKRLIIERVWDCAKHHYRDTKTQLTVADLEVLLRDLYFDQPKSLKSYSRAHSEYPDLLPWPITYGMRPPWESDEAEPELVDRAADQMRNGQLYFTETAFEVIASSGARTHAQLVIAPDGSVRARLLMNVLAAVFTVIALDIRDGKPDGVIHWCVVLGHMLSQRL